MFAIQGAPLTPASGDKFATGCGNGCGGPLGNPVTRRELQALFDVIGTPAWACIDNVASPHWRSYLMRLPGKAPKLFRCVRPLLGASPEAPSRTLPPSHA